MANRFWVGGTGNWDAAGTTHWSATSGGASGASTPTNSDDVFFDGNSGGGTVTSTWPAFTKDFTCTGFTGTITGASNLAFECKGSFTLASGMTWTRAGGISFTGVSSHTINLAGKTLLNSSGLNCLGTYTAVADITVTGASKGWVVGAGTFDANDYNITGAFLGMDGEADSITYMGSGLWTATGANAYFEVIGYDTGVPVIYPETSTVVINATSGTGFIGATNVDQDSPFATSFYNVTLTGATFGLYDVGTTGTLTYLTPAGTLELYSDVGAIPVSTLNIQGTAGNLITFNGPDIATITKASGTVTVDYVSMNNIVATGGATFTAGSHSFDNGGNTGWSFTPAAIPPQTPANFAQKITILASKVSGDQRGFPVYLNLADLASDFWTSVRSDGGNIRITTYDQTTEVPYELVAIDTSAHTGNLWFKGDLSSTQNTVFYIKYGQPTATAYARTAPLGADNVWTGAYGIYHGASTRDSSINARTANLYEVSQGSGYFSFPGEVDIGSNITGSTALSFGKTTTYQRIAQSFVAGAAGVINAHFEIMLRRLASGGTPANTVTFAIHANNAGSPATSALMSNTQSSTNFNTTTNTDTMMQSLTGVALVAGTTYWVVITASSLSDTNYWNLAYDPAGVYGTLKTYDGAAWNTTSGSLRFAVYKSGFVDIAPNGNISVPYNNFSVRFKMLTTNTAYQAWVTKSLNNSNGQIEMNTSTDIRFESDTNNVQQFTVDSGVTLSSGTEHSIQILSNTTGLYLYVDGVLRSTQSALSDTVAQRYEYLGGVQGRLNGRYGQAFEGRMWDVFFRPAISSGQITTEYNNQSSPSTFYTITDLVTNFLDSSAYGSSGGPSTAVKKPVPQPPNIYFKRDLPTKLSKKNEINRLKQELIKRLI